MADLVGKTALVTPSATLPHGAGPDDEKIKPLFTKIKAINESAVALRA